ncbi:hypothetical protein [Corallococcus exercitus]|uniref:Uncharacterized protein n=1 Tax=Corallococcus exercitus TaxID=2316736 RepID=A0A7Y4JPF1_9BACT|nr:hypothetical protein [Corallococcus exercitus]NOK08746.1 hypothetical protein [Corallococcus exercitus]
MATHRERSIAPWLLTGCAALILLALAFRDHWLLLTRNDLGVPRGFYPCEVRMEHGTRTRQCNIGADGIILREEQFADGTVRRTWFAEGREPLTR